MAYPNQILPEPAAGAVHVNVSLVLNDGELWVTDPYTVMHAEKARFIKRSCNLHVYTNKCLVIGNGHNSTQSPILSIESPFMILSIQIMPVFCMYNYTVRLRHSQTIIGSYRGRRTRS